MRRAIAYVDGFNLYYGLRSQFEKKYLWLDLSTMIGHYLQPDHSLIEVKYFTSKVRQTQSDPFKLKRQLAYINAVESSRSKIYYGEYIVKQYFCPDCNFHIDSCPKCQKQLEFFNEKKTDVNIASEMLTDAFKDRFDVAYLVSGDRDLSSPIEKIRRMFHSKKVFVLFPPNRLTSHLTKICDKHFTVDEESLINSQFCDHIEFEKKIVEKGVEVIKNVIADRPKEWS